MDELWVDQFDLTTPPLTRAPTSASVDGEVQEKQVEILTHGISQRIYLLGRPPNSLSRRIMRAVFFTDPMVSSWTSHNPTKIQTLRLRLRIVKKCLSRHPSPSNPFPQMLGISADEASPDWMSSGSIISSPMSATFSDVTSKPAASPVRMRTNSVSHRKALLIGIKYYRNKLKESFKGPTSLKGPHHDVREVQRLLQDVYGWDSECFRILKDDNGPKENQPTLQNIRREIVQLVEGARPGDHLFFYFSGHGGQIADTDGDEDDGKDEVIISCDGELLVDDELHDMLVKPLPAGCYLTALLDCCSSGTSLDLPYNALQSRDPAKRGSLIYGKHSKGNVILLSACADSERAYEKEVREDNYKRVRGMLTKAFVDSLKTRRKSTYNELMTSVRSFLNRMNAMQDPQLSSSQLLNMNDYFDFFR